MWLEDFWPVVQDGAKIGHLTSASFSPRLAFNMGYVWVPIELAATGSRIEIESPEGMKTATVTPLPFLDPKKEIPAKG